MASFQEVFAGKRFVCCALTVLSIYTSECKSIVGWAWGSTILFNLRTHVRNCSRRACLSSACSAASLSNCLVRKRMYNTCRANENILWNASLCATRCICMFASHKPVKNNSQKAQKRLCCWVFLVAFLWALYSDLLSTLLRVLWSSRAWRKMSWRYSFFRCLYPCLGKRLEFRFVSYEFLFVWSYPRRVFESHETATQRASILSILHPA